MQQAEFVKQTIAAWEGVELGLERRLAQFDKEQADLDTRREQALSAAAKAPTEIKRLQGVLKDLQSRKGPKGPATRVPMTLTEKRDKLLQKLKALEAEILG